MPLPTRKKAIGCRWMFALKFNLDGYVARLKVLLVAKAMLRFMTLIILILFLL